MKKNVLIVDDNPEQSVAVQARLLNTDLEIGCVYTVRNGREGTAVLENYQIDLILTDVHMPEMDGLEFLNHVRNHPQFRFIPAMVLADQKDKALEEKLAFWGHGYLHTSGEDTGWESEIHKHYGN